MIPKLISDKTSIFRYYSCKFRYEQSKLSAARVVLAKEFNITCCYTFENSIFAYLDKNRLTKVFDTNCY